MKRTLLAGLAMLAISASMYGQTMMKGGEYTHMELKAIESDLGDRPFGELTLNELTPYWARIQGAAQKDMYINKAAAMSMHFPGSAQIRNGDTVQGIGFIALHVGTVAGTLAAWYFLLPADLRFDTLDYLANSKASVRAAWESHSIQEYLPAMGVAAAGMLLDGGIRIWSAVAAKNGAKAAVESGTARLSPMVGPGYMGMGLRF